MGRDLLPREQADGRIHRRRGGADRAEGEVLIRRASPPALLLLFCLAAAAAFAVSFPPLTGRIVDRASIISAETKAALEPKLAELESKSGIQLVIATVTSLEGQEIEPYANELFRAWKLGESQKNNGVLLLVAPNERRVRIEVGYGLEGTLTDALAAVIITNAMTPRFKAGDFSGGIARGVDDIITVLTTDASEWQRRPSLRVEQQGRSDPANWLVMALVVGVVVLLIVSPGFRWFFFNLLASASFGTGGYRSGGGGSGGGFAGGGGSSGGGGASGRW